MADMDPRPDPDWEEGKFQILFISVGQGDCCLVTCPNGQHILIDCGSKSHEEGAMPWGWAVLRGPWGLARPGTRQDRLSAVILTHPDQDHYNKVKYMIGRSDEGAAIPVSEVYFSDVNTARTDYKSGPLAPYNAGDCGSTLIDVCGARTLYRVTLREGTQSIHTWWPATAKQFISDDELIDGDRVRVAEGEFPEPDDDDDDGVESTEWEVSIIAGNVLRNTATDHSDFDGRNAASLVTLVRFGTEKVLICGDATRSTQEYLYNTFKNTDDLKNLEMLHVPHHGSPVTSSTADFVKLLQPKRVVITVKSDEHTHHLPGMDVIDAYHDYAAASEEPHPSRAWKRVTDTAFQKLRVEWEKGKGETIDYKPSAETGVRRYTRTDIADGFEGEVVLDGVGAPGTAVKYVLYQRQLTRDIKQTGSDENQWCYLPS